MPEPWQVLTFENELVGLFGPEWSALAAGFAILIGATLYITPSGERYLERQDP